MTGHVRYLPFCIYTVALVSLSFSDEDRIVFCVTSVTMYVMCTGYLLQRRKSL